MVSVDSHDSRRPATKPQGSEEPQDPKRSRGLAGRLGVGLLVAACAVLAAGTVAAEDVAHPIRLRLEDPSRPGVFEVALPRGDIEPLRARQALPAFYAQRAFSPAWPGRDATDELIAALEEAESHGLRSGDYHLPAIRSLRKLTELRPSAGVSADLDLLLTDAFLTYGAHLVSGRVDPATFDADWRAVRREIDLVALAHRAAESGRPGQALRELLPTDPGYGRLRAALADLRRQEPWPLPSPGVTLRPGDDDPRVVELRRRLEAERGASSAEPAGASSVFDSELEAAVRAFQFRHGLGSDGVVGEKTLAALRVSRDERIAQLEMNLERWRWLPRELGSRHVLVNIPEFVLRLREDGRDVLEMPVVVGRDARRTPVMSDQIRYMVLNPFWEVPPKLAVQDKLPEIVKDPEYLSRNGFRVLEGWGAAEREVDPASVDWSQLGRSFPYRLRQSPGPRNALGRVKFMFPNVYNVYIHDTPERGLFARPDRAASSGCIRVERPLELAARLLAGTPWDAASLHALIDSGRTETVSLPKPVPVHLEYWTAWVAEDGEVHFRRDVYGRDAMLAEALLRPAARPAE